MSCPYAAWRRRMKCTSEGAPTLRWSLWHKGSNPISRHASEALMAMSPVKRVERGRGVRRYYLSNGMLVCVLAEHPIADTL